MFFKAGVTVFIYFTKNTTAVKLLNWSSSYFVLSKRLLNWSSSYFVLSKRLLNWSSSYFVLSKRVNNRKSIGVVFYLCFYTFYIFTLSEFMFYLCYLYLFTHTGVQHDYNIRWCSCSLTVTPRVTLLSRCTYILLDIHGQFTFAILHHYKVYSVM